MGKISQETKMIFPVIVVFIFVAVGYVLFKGLSPGILDEGPMKGQVFAEIQPLQPDQEYEIYGDMHLEIYDPLRNGREPAVILKGPGGRY